MGVRNQIETKKNQEELSPMYEIIDDGYILPCKVKNTQSGGVCDKNKNIVESSLYDGGWLKRGAIWI